MNYWAKTHSLNNTQTTSATFQRTCLYKWVKKTVTKVKRKIRQKKARGNGDKDQKPKTHRNLREFNEIKK